jgi:hypothetical protein
MVGYKALNLGSNRGWSNFENARNGRLALTQRNNNNYKKPLNASKLVAFLMAVYYNTNKFFKIHYILVV